MSLRSLLLSSDEPTIRTLRRVLGDLEIGVECCHAPEVALRKLTRQRFEALILDTSHLDDTRKVLEAAKASPANNRVVAIMLVESAVGLRGGFELGGHFVLHKPLSMERARSSFRAVRALMKRERRRQGRVAVQLAVECRGLKNAETYRAHTLDVSEGGMALQFDTHHRKVKESSFRFRLELPGLPISLEFEGELAWEGSPRQAGVRFKNVLEEDAALLRDWLDSQLPAPDRDDPPITCRLTDLTLGGCYLETASPFCVGTRVSLSTCEAAFQVRATGLVRVMHPETGMGVEFSRDTPAQHEQVRGMIETLRSSGVTSSELLAEPYGLETLDTQANSDLEDPLVQLFRQKADVPTETFLRELREQRVAGSS